ncbi:MAG: hypothetical protein R3C42_08800 [Parvularculaceae bacterium]
MTCRSAVCGLSPAFAASGAPHPVSADAAIDAATSLHAKVRVKTGASFMRLSMELPAHLR